LHVFFDKAAVLYEYLALGLSPSLMLKKRTIVPPLRLVFLMWLTYWVQVTFSYDLGFLGVLPRNTYGLIGIFTAPLVHGNLTHIISNSVPLLILGIALFLFYPKVSNLVFLICYAMPSVFVWIFARNFYHIGASGLVYALAFFLIALGFFRRDTKSILVSFSVIVIYGGVLFNTSMLSSEVSWEAHVFGALVGIGTALGIHRAFST
jgi:membrane associated rhomboid family serine protease